MDWLGDFVRYCSHSLGGLMLLAVSGFLVLLAVVACLALVAATVRGGRALGTAFVRGWRSADR